MVPYDYLSRKEMFFDIMLRHIMTFIRTDKPYTLRWSLINPLFKLVFKFIHKKYYEDSMHYYAIKLYGPIVRNNDLRNDFYVRVMNLLTNEQMPDLTKYVITNYKPDYIYENNIYKLASALYGYVDDNDISHSSLFRAEAEAFQPPAGKYSDGESDMSFLEIEPIPYILPHFLVDEDEDEYVPDTLTVNEFKPKPNSGSLKAGEYKSIMILASACLMYFKQFGRNNYDELMLRYEVLNKEYYNPALLIGEFMPIIDSIDEHSLHKIINKGIQEKEIYLLSTFDINSRYSFKCLSGMLGIYKTYMLVMFKLNPLAVILLYYIQKCIPLTTTYNSSWKGFYNACELILKDADFNTINLIKKELNYIKKHFHYGTCIDKRETIMINSIVIYTSSEK